MRRAIVALLSFRTATSTSVTDKPAPLRLPADKLVPSPATVNYVDIMAKTGLSSSRQLEVSLGGRELTRTPELHVASKMPIAQTLMRQAFVLLTAAGCFLAQPKRREALAALLAFPWLCDPIVRSVAWALQLLASTLYIHHCASCYPAQLIRRRINSVELVDQRAAQTPSVLWTARAYHWETRWRRVSYGSGKDRRSRMEPYQVKVTTHVAESELASLQWAYEEARAGATGKRLWTSLRARFRVVPEDATEYSVLRSEFMHVHDRDSHLDFTETVYMGGRKLRRDKHAGQLHAWDDTLFYLVVPDAARHSAEDDALFFGRPTLKMWMLACALLMSAPYQAWLASRMKALAASAAVEYTRSFKIDLEAARAAMNLDERALEDRRRALEMRRRWRGVRLFGDIARLAIR